MHDEYRLETVVLNTLIPLPSYLFSPMARLLLGLHVLGSLLIGKLRTLAWLRTHLDMQVGVPPPLIYRIAYVFNQ